MLNVSKVITFAAAAILMSATAVAQTRAVVTESPAIEGLELLKSIGDYQQELLVYKSVKPTSEVIDRRFEFANIMAKKAGMVFSGERGHMDDNRLALRNKEDASASFEVDQLTGNFLFESGLAKYGKEENTRGLPPQERLKELAFKTLESLDLAIDPQEFRVEHIGGLNMGAADGSGRSAIYEKLKTIHLSRVLGGLPVMGDARIVMHFGEDSVMSGLVYQVPTLASKARLSSRLIQTPEVLQKKAFGELSAMAKKAMRSRLSEVKLVLFDDGRGIMEPAYHIVLERFMSGLGDKPVMIPYDFYLPVSSKPVAFFPHMEVSLFLPEDGSNTQPSKGGSID